MAWLENIMEGKMHGKGGHICLVGPNRFQNDLFVFSISSVRLENCFW
jgi:hypothetical protein